MELPNRMRINATLRMGTQREALMKKEAVSISKQKLALEVNVPPTLQKPNQDPLLRPLQTNTRQLEAQGNPLTEPIKKKSPRGIRKEYKLVQDSDIPLILKDARHNITYKKLNCLGSVSKEPKKKKKTMKVAHGYLLGCFCKGISFQVS